MADDHERSTRNSASENLRMRLAAVGIILDPTPSIAPIAAPIPVPDPPPDRDAIRAILEPRGCPEWAIASCPSVAAALTYRRSDTEK